MGLEDLELMDILHASLSLLFLVISLIMGFIFHLYKMQVLLLFHIK